MSSKLEQCFNNKTVLITGHTGFKGSWLSVWLHLLGAKVIGVSDSIPTNPANFLVSKLSSIVEDNRCDIRELGDLSKIIDQVQPDFVFHLAAQAIVKDSYTSSIETLSTNIMGTSNVLESLKRINKTCVAIMITSDKCYDNVEWSWGYRETDRLGGKDPYSASKGAAELIIRTYVESFFQDSNIKIGVGRAGNVIGGGDWAPFRLVPDCIRSWAKKETVQINNPKSTRPWQIVLEPLSGYLNLALALNGDNKLHGHAFNFGPLAENNYSVQTLIEEMQKHWGNVNWKTTNPINDQVYEAGLLKLNCDKALHYLKWIPTYDFQDTIASTMSWYKYFYNGSADMMQVTKNQLEDYQRTAKAKGLNWAQ